MNNKYYSDVNNYFHTTVLGFCCDFRINFRVDTLVAFISSHVFIIHYCVQIMRNYIIIIENEKFYSESNKDVVYTSSKK